MASTVQLNARMDSAIKSSGDEALAAIGLSPTQAVRALWEKASRRGKDLEEVAALLCEDRTRRIQAGGLLDDAVSTGWTIIDDVFASYGLNYKPAKDMPSDGELLEQTLLDRMAERGLS